ncbi:MAG: hypothetical protein WBG42_11265, partial [Cryomorphaceae bacterium]
TYRSDINSSINGFPALTFSQGQLLELESSDDINLEDVVTEKTIFVAFRTGNDVTTRQMIYEEGGGWRGLNTYIYNQELYISGYDLNNNGVNNNGSQTDPDGTPWWGHVFRKNPVQPNTSYVLTMVFWGVEGNTNGGNLDGDIYGYLNGSAISSQLTWNSDGYGAEGVGSLGEHPDPIGIGAVRKDSFTEDGPIGNQTGLHHFLGRIAEVILYNERINDAKRIIVQNYLGAKYFADIIADDRYEFQTNFGFDVIGLARVPSGLAGFHNLSKGRNPFTITGESTTAGSQPKFALCGHNGLDLDTTSINTPETDGSIVRWRRIYRMDKQLDDVGDITFSLDENDLPPPPAGFTKLVLLLDDNGGNFANFEPASKVIEVSETFPGSEIYELETPIADGSFFTFGYVKPTVIVANTTKFGFEGNSGTSNVITEFKLNYDPAQLTAINFSVDPGTTDGPGVDYNAPSTFSVQTLLRSAFTTSQIIGDVISEDTEIYEIQLLNSPGLNAGRLDGSFAT